MRVSVDGVEPAESSEDGTAVELESEDEEEVVTERERCCQRNALKSGDMFVGGGGIDAGGDGAPAGCVVGCGAEDGGAGGSGGGGCGGKVGGAEGCCRAIERVVGPDLFA